MVATPELVVYPRPPCNDPLFIEVTELIRLAEVTVIMALFEGIVPPKFVPAIVIVSFVTYPLPGSVTAVR